VLRVAELPTCQYTPYAPPEIPFSTATVELLAVVSVLAIWNTKAAVGSFWKLSVSVPVNAAEDEKEYTPGVSVSPPRSRPSKLASPIGPQACCRRLWHRTALAARPHQSCASRLVTRLRPAEIP